MIKNTIRIELGLPIKNNIIISMIGNEGEYIQRIRKIEKIYELLLNKYDTAVYIIVSPDNGKKGSITYYNYYDQKYSLHN